jgi:arylformamidase
MRIHDLTHVLGPATLMYPGDPPFRTTEVAGYADHGYRVSEIQLGTHAGTHVDAPAHFIPGGLAVDELPLAALIGPARVADVDRALPVARGERVLLRSGWGHRWGHGGYFDDFPGLPPDLAQSLADAPAALVGMETPSLHPDEDEDLRLHRLLLEAGVLILENLANLEFLPDHVDLVALPMPFQGQDAAPCRVVALEREPNA